MINSCKEQPVLQLIKNTELNFPSASAIEFYNNKIYVFGDDAPYLLIVDTDHQPIDSINYWGNESRRISKKTKPDIESCFISNDENPPLLTALGSMSDIYRWKVLRYDLSNKQLDTSSYFLSRETMASVQQLNIEGGTAVNETLVLANRANLSNPVNHLLFYDSSQTLTSKRLVLPSSKTVAGVSGLYYIKEKDLLLFTASEEATASTTADGAIGESYLGGIENFSARMTEGEFKPAFFYRLTDFEQKLVGQKIESVCMEKIEGDILTLHLASDNDNGKSMLFKFRFNWKKGQ